MLSFSNPLWNPRLLCQKAPFLRRFLCHPIPLIYGDKIPTHIPKNAILVLPPSDYWAINATLNVKTAKEAALFGSALFDLSDEYRYEARKIGKNSYSLIAFNPTEISQKLKSFPAVSMVERFTFAQWVFDDLSCVIRLENGKVLTMLEGIVIEIKSEYLLANDAIEMEEALQKPHFSISSIALEHLRSSTLTPKTVKTTLFIFLLILGNLTTNTLLNYQESSQLETLKEEILENTKLPETSFERDAILASLQKKEASQFHLREQFLHISDRSLHVKVATTVSAPLPQTPVPPVTPVDGVVLIPGSKPGEANRLLVGSSSNSPSPAVAITFQGEGIEEITYDGKTTKMLIQTRDDDAKEELKKTIISQFKKAKFNEHGHQLEVTLP